MYMHMYRYVLREALLTRSEELKYTAYADTESRGSQQGSWQGSQQGSWQGSQPEDGEGSGGDGDHVPLLAQLSAIAESEREFGDSPRRRYLRHVLALTSTPNHCTMTL